jgi:Co/Zn/Cd efflux system component
VFLYLAFVLPQGVSRNLVRSANFFNSIGLVPLSALLPWQAADRLLHRVPVLGVVPIIIGLAAAVANWGMARLLLHPGRNSPAIRF